eukprot:scaffold108665_cov34-Prasinocladus_malaysianus.AAC.1
MEWLLYIQNKRRTWASGPQPSGLITIGLMLAALKKSDQDIITDLWNAVTYLEGRTSKRSQLLMVMQARYLILMLMARVVAHGYPRDSIAPDAAGRYDALIVTDEVLAELSPKERQKPVGLMLPPIH